MSNEQCDYYERDLNAMIQSVCIHAIYRGCSKCDELQRNACRNVVDCVSQYTCRGCPYQNKK